MSSNDGVGSGDAVGVELTAMLARLAELADAAVDDPTVAAAARVDRIAVLERLRAGLAAAQHTEMVAFARSRVDEQAELVAAGRLDPETLGRGIADEIALAAHVSSWQGSRRLNIATALNKDLPDIRGLLTCGRISEKLAEVVVGQTSHLDPEQRRLVDEQLAEYHDLGITEFVLSGHPHLEEAHWVGEGPLAELGRRGLWRPAAGSEAARATDAPAAPVPFAGAAR